MASTSSYWGETYLNFPSPFCGMGKRIICEYHFMSFLSKKKAHHPRPQQGYSYLPHHLYSPLSFIQTNHHDYNVLPSQLGSQQHHVLLRLSKRSLWILQGQRDQHRGFQRRCRKFDLVPRPPATAATCACWIRHTCQDSQTLGNFVVSGRSWTWRTWIEQKRVCSWIWESQKKYKNEEEIKGFRIKRQFGLLYSLQFGYNRYPHSRTGHRTLLAEALNTKRRWRRRWQKRTKKTNAFCAVSNSSPSKLTMSQF